MKRFFVTGTDTGVGKTTVSCSLLAAARARGLRVDAIKPVETGCTRDAHGHLQPDDGLALARAATGNADANHRCVYLFERPLAPAVAARLEERTIDIEPIEQAVRASSGELVLVEGAGGLLVPLTDELDMAGLARRLELPLLIVARDSLGTINHTLLTVEAARHRGLTVAGVILSATPDTPHLDVGLNSIEISRLGRVPVLGWLPRQRDLSPDPLGRAAEANLDLSRLLG